MLDDRSLAILARQGLVVVRHVDVIDLLRAFLSLLLARKALPLPITATTAREPVTTTRGRLSAAEVHDRVTEMRDRIGRVDPAVLARQRSAERDAADPRPAPPPPPIPRRTA